MGRPKKYREPDVDDMRLIVALKQERQKLLAERKWIKERDEKIRCELKELENAAIAAKFDVSVWTVREA